MEHHTYFPIINNITTQIDKQKSIYKDANILKNVQAVYIFMHNKWFLFISSARHKIDEDLEMLERQLRLQAGEEEEPEMDEEGRPADAFLKTPMVNS